MLLVLAPGDAPRYGVSVSVLFYPPTDLIAMRDSVANEEPDQDADDAPQGTVFHKFILLYVSSLSA